MLPLAIEKNKNCWREGGSKGGDISIPMTDSC